MAVIGQLIVVAVVKKLDGRQICLQFWYHTGICEQQSAFFVRSWHGALVTCLLCFILHNALVIIINQDR